MFLLFTVYGLLAFYYNLLVGYEEAEFAWLQYPLAVKIDEGQVFGRKLQGYGSCLTGLQVHLFESTQPSVVGSKRSDKVGTVEQNTLLGGPLTGIRYIDADRKNIAFAEGFLIDLHITIGNGGVV